MIVRIIRTFANSIILKQASLRARFYGLFIKKMGKSVKLMHNVRILDPQKVTIGDFTYINHNTDIYGQGGVSIGKYVLIGQNCNIMSVNHAYKDYNKPIAQQGIEIGSIVIEDDVWIGGNVTILPNVTIHKGAIVGANAVVTKDVQAYSIVGGVPAKFIKYRFDENLRKKANDLSFND